MNVLAHDPFVSGDTALDGTVLLVKDLQEMLRRCDCVTLHAASPPTRAILGDGDRGDEAWCPAYQLRSRRVDR